MSEFHRLCQRIAANDPSLSRVVVPPPQPPPAAPTATATPWKWDAETAAEFAGALSTNTIVESVEIIIGVGSGRQVGRREGEGGFPSEIDEDAAAGSGRSSAGGDWCLSSLSASAHIGRALARVKEIQLIGDDDHVDVERTAATTDGGGNRTGGGLLLHVILTVLGSSTTRLRRIKLSNISINRSSSWGLWNLLSRTTSLVSIGLSGCCFNEGWRDADPMSSSPSLSVPANRDPRRGQETGIAVAAMVSRAFESNRTLERVSVDAFHEGSSEVLGAVVDGLTKRQEKQLRHPNRRPVNDCVVLQVFELRLSTWTNIDLPVSLFVFLAKTTVREIRVRGGGQRHLHLILASMWQNHPKSPWPPSAPTTNTRKLHLQGCQVGRYDVARLARRMSHDSAFLSELVIHEVDLGLEGFLLLMRAISNSRATLQALDLFDVRAVVESRSGNDSLLVPRLLRDLLRSNHQLRVLKLGDLALGGEEGSQFVAEGLSSNQTLRVLDLFNVYNVDLQVLAMGCSHLHKLGLSLCCFAIGPHRLAQLLTTLQKRARNLTDLDLTNNRFGNSEAVVLSVFVRQTLSLRRLSLDQNEITDTGAVALFSCLENHVTMKEFTMSGNRLGDSTILALLDTLPALRLQYLVLWWDEKESDNRLMETLTSKLALNSSLIGLDLENSMTRANRQSIDYYLYRNRLFPWLSEQSVPASLWPITLSRLSRSHKSAAFYVMQEKVPIWMVS